MFRWRMPVTDIDVGPFVAARLFDLDGPDGVLALVVEVL
jgi:hypothetical protein